MNKNLLILSLFLIIIGINVVNAEKVEFHFTNNKFESDASYVDIHDSTKGIYRHEDLVLTLSGDAEYEDDCIHTSKNYSIKVVPLNDITIRRVAIGTADYSSDALEWISRSSLSIGGGFVSDTAGNGKTAATWKGATKEEFYILNCGNQYFTNIVIEYEKDSAGDVDSPTHSIDFISANHGSLPVTDYLEDVKWLTDEHTFAEIEYTVSDYAFRMYIPLNQSIAIIADRGLMINRNQMLRFGFADSFAMRRITKIVIEGENIENLFIGRNTEEHADPRYAGGYEKIGEITITDDALIWRHLPEETDIREFEIWNDFAEIQNAAAGRALAAVEQMPTIIRSITLSSEIPTGIRETSAINEKPVFFDLQGRQIKNPTAGIYIRVAGNKTSKVAITRVSN